MLPACRMPSAIGKRLVERQECPVPIPVSHQAVGGEVISSWTGFQQDALERLGAMEEMIWVQVAMTSVALGWSNLVLACAIKDLEGAPTSESERRRVE